MKHHNKFDLLTMLFAAVGLAGCDNDSDTFMPTTDVNVKNTAILSKKYTIPQPIHVPATT